MKKYNQNLNNMLINS